MVLETFLSRYVLPENDSFDKMGVMTVIKKETSLSQYFILQMLLCCTSTVFLNHTIPSQLAVAIAHT